MRERLLFHNQRAQSGRYCLVLGPHHDCGQSSLCFWRGWMGSRLGSGEYRPSKLWGC
ncbi:unnamed protein product, partial [Gulo gulo]